MRKFSLLSALKASVVTGLTAKPKPLAGKFPTRIALAVVFRDKRRPPWTYMGKPNACAVNAFKRRCNAGEGLAVEFDGNGPILIVRFVPLGPRAKAGTFFSLYHPYTANASEFGHFNLPPAVARHKNFPFYLRLSEASLNKHEMRVGEKLACLSGKTQNESFTAQF